MGSQLWLALIWGWPRLLRCRLPLSLRVLARGVPTSASPSPPLPLPAPLSTPLPLLPEVKHENCQMYSRPLEGGDSQPHCLSLSRCYLEQSTSTVRQVLSRPLTERRGSQAHHLSLVELQARLAQTLRRPVELQHMMSSVSFHGLP